MTYWGQFPVSQSVWSALSSLATVSCLRSTKRYLYSVIIRSVAWFRSRKVGMMLSHILLSFSLPLTLPILYSHLPCCLLGLPSLPRSFLLFFLPLLRPSLLSLPPSCLPSFLSLLPTQSFGYLVPSNQPSKILGVVFDSSTFPELNRTDLPSTRLTVS